MSNQTLRREKPCIVFIMLQPIKEKFAKEKIHINSRTEVLK